MKIELKKISLSKMLSEETPAYSAQVWVDGRHFADVSNHGQGGCDEVHPPRGTALNDAGFNRRLAELEAHIKATYPKQTFEAGGEEHSYDTDLEVLCHELLGAWELEKDVKRDLSRKVMFVKPVDGQIYGVKIPSPAQRQAMIDAVKKAHKIDRVLNEMPIDEVVAIYRKVAA